MSAQERIRIDRYEPTAIEPRWQRRWAELRLADTDLGDTSRPDHRPGKALRLYLLVGFRSLT